MASVKTAISIDEALFKQLEDLAREMKVSRSRLFALALKEYLRRRRIRDLQEKIDAAYAEPMDEAERAFVRASMACLAELTKDDEW